MYRIIFKHHLKEGQEGAYVKQWQTGSDIIQTYSGARGTKLFRKVGESNFLYAMAEWDSKEARNSAVETIKRERADADFVLKGHEAYLESHETIGEFEYIAESNPPTNEELEKTKSRAQEYLDNWKRERADFLNYKKDEAKRLEEFLKFANEAVILDVIDVLDDLERATTEVKNEGLEQVLKKFQNLLKRYGIERIAVSDKFDPLLYEAMETEEGGEKIQEVRPGYTMNGKVIRSARVSVQKLTTE